MGGDVQHDGRLVKLLGSAQQFSSEATEHCHITMAKVPYRASNKRNFEEQMCRYLDRREKVRCFEMYQEWLALGLNDTAPAAPKDNEDALSDADAETVRKLTRSERWALFKSKFLPKPIKDEFEDDLNPRSSTTAFLLTSTISRRFVPIQEAADLFQLRNFRTAMKAFFNPNRQDAPLPFNEIDVWYSVRMQKRPRYGEPISEPMTVSASPPDAEYPSGLYNFVLVRDPSSSGPFKGM